MTIADVVDFYVRREIRTAKGGGAEEACTGCDHVLDAGEEYSYYVIASHDRTPRKLPYDINLCRKCTFLVIGSNMKPAPAPEA